MVTIATIINWRKMDIVPSISEILSIVGENIRLARLGRRLTAEQVAKMSEISRLTLRHVEKGAVQVAMGTYCKVLFVLGLQNDLLKIGAEDFEGRKSKEWGLQIKKRVRQIKLSGIPRKAQKYGKDCGPFLK